MISLIPNFNNKMSETDIDKILSKYENRPAQFKRSTFEVT